MKIALLGYGKEGKSTEAYFKKHHSNLECEVLENFTYDEIKTQDFSGNPASPNTSSTNALAPSSASPPPKVKAPLVPSLNLS